MEIRSSLWLSRYSAECGRIAETVIPLFNLLQRFGRSAKERFWPHRFAGGLLHPQIGNNIANSRHSFHFGSNGARLRDAFANLRGAAMAPVPSLGVFKGFQNCPAL